jgi:hypothetical protein
MLNEWNAVEMDAVGCAPFFVFVLSGYTEKNAAEMDAVGCSPLFVLALSGYTEKKRTQWVAAFIYYFLMQFITILLPNVCASSRVHTPRSSLTPSTMCVIFSSSVAVSGALVLESMRVISFILDSARGSFG